MTTDSPPRVALVVGASSGIGRETALGLARCGMRLALAARGRAALEAVAEGCRAAGALDVYVHPVDVGERDQVEELIGATVGRFGRLDAVVVSAAVTVFGGFEEIPPEVFDKVLQTNVTGTVSIVRAVLPHLRRSGRGDLVLVSSLLGRAAVPYQSPYILSMFAMNGLIRLLRHEYRGRGVRIHGVYPGAVDTPIYAAGGNYTGRDVRPPPPVHDPEAVARRIVRAVRGRCGVEHNVGPENRMIVFGFRRLPWLYDAIVEPLVRAVMFTSQRRRSGPGNVFEPVPHAPDGPRPGDHPAAVDGVSRPVAR